MSTTRQITRFIVRGHRDRSYNIAVVGTLDAASAGSLRFLLQDLQRDEVTIDLTECTSVSDEALATLAQATRLAAAHGGDVRLRPGSARGAAAASVASGELPRRMIPSLIVA